MDLLLIRIGRTLKPHYIRRHLSAPLKTEVFTIEPCMGYRVRKRGLGVGYLGSPFGICQNEPYRAAPPMDSGVYP